jgi:hypothetical protein
MITWCKGTKKQQKVAAGHSPIGGRSPSLRSNGHAHMSSSGNTSSSVAASSSAVAGGPNNNNNPNNEKRSISRHNLNNNLMNGSNGDSSNTSIARARSRTQLAPDR